MTEKIYIEALLNQIAEFEESERDEIWNAIDKTEKF